jgi:hypothetical protein
MESTLTKLAGRTASARGQQHITPQIFSGLLGDIEPSSDFDKVRWPLTETGCMAGEAEDTKKSDPRAKIFISYSRKDMAFADRLEA